MVRRLTVEEPPSRLAIWSRRLVLFALAVLLMAVVLVRGGFVEAVPGAVVLMSALALAGLGILFALGAFIAIWINGNPGLGKALTAVFVGSLLLAYPAYVGLQGYGLPAINDITTDTINPPQFEVIAALRPRGANPTVYPGPETAERQRAAYPEIAPLTLAVSAEDAYAGAFDVVSRHKSWRIVADRAPQAGRRDGRMEAVALTPVMGFRDDVVIRVRAAGSGSVIDIRSASRYGTHDFGNNARRVRSLVEEIEEELAAQPAAR